MSKAFKSEAAKLQGRTDLGEYWIATSASLSAGAKEKICQLFREQGVDAAHVLAREDLDNLLTLHPQIEQQTYKLYMTSPVILQKLLHNAVNLGSEDLLRQLQSRRRLYVQSDAFPAATDALQHNRFCVLSGPPGVGKTTLGEMLMLRFLEEGYEPILVQADIAEASDVWREERKQIFFYDDFLGTNGLNDGLHKNEDGRLNRFIQRVQSSSKHLLVLMTREYILKQATFVHEKLADLESAKVTIDLDSYSRFQRAHIIYNHIYFSQLNGAARSSIVAGGSYLRLIDHRNYNPRLIELIITTAIAAGAPDSEQDFAGFAERSLEDPSRLWEHIFENQLSEHERAILLALVTMPNLVAMDDLRAAFESLTNPGRRLLHPDPFVRAMRVLEGVFIKVQQLEGERVVLFSNPGLRDYIWDYAAERPTLSRQLVNTFVFSEQFEIAAVPIRAGALSLLRSVPTREALEVAIETLGSRPAQFGRYNGFIGSRQQVGQQGSRPIEHRLLGILKFAQGRGEAHVTEIIKNTKVLLSHRLDERCSLPIDTVNLLVWLSSARPGDGWVLDFYSNALRFLESSTEGELPGRERYSLLQRLKLLDRAAPAEGDQALFDSFIAYAEQRVAEGLSSSEYNEAATAFDDVAEQLGAFGIVIQDVEGGVALQEWVEDLAAHDDGDEEPIVPSTNSNRTDENVAELFATLLV